jgi:hypothetical protein
MRQPESLAHEPDHAVVGMQGVEVDLREAVQLGAVAELVLQVRLEAREEVGLAHAPALELEERVGAVALGGALHRPAEGRGLDPGHVLDGGERLHERRRQDAPEVGDDRLQCHAVTRSA